MRLLHGNRLGQEPDTAHPCCAGRKRNSAAHHGVLRHLLRKRQRPGQVQNHAFANIAGVIIIVVTLFICYRNMTNFLTSLQALIGM